MLGVGGRKFAHLGRCRLISIHMEQPHQRITEHLAQLFEVILEVITVEVRSYVYIHENRMCTGHSIIEHHRLTADNSTTQHLSNFEV